LMSLEWRMGLRRSMTRQPPREGEAAEIG